MLRFIYFFIAAIVIWSYFAGLPIDVTRDAGKYATIAKEMFLNGNYINLTIHGDAYDQKPPMLFWLGAIGFSIGGISNFWLKFPLLLLVFAGFYWAFQLGKSLYNKKVGYLTATFLALSIIYSLYSMDIHTDTPLQAFITLALWQLFEFIKTKKNKHWIFGFLAIGLAMLSKGPIGAAIPAFAVIGHLLMKKDYRFLFDYRWFLGIILAVAVTSPALIGLMNQFGWDGIRFFFWDNNIGRITGSYAPSVNHPTFYILALFYLLLPWVLLFFIATFNEFKTLIKNKFVANEYFTLCGIWIYFIIISASKNQLPNYIHSIVPLMAVLTAKWVVIATEDKRKLFKLYNYVQYFGTFIIWILIAALAFYFFPSPKLYYWVFAIAGISLSIYVLAKMEDSYARLLTPLLIAFSCLMLLLNTNVFPYIFSFQAPPKAARYYNEHAKKTDKLYNYKYGQYELFFYSEPEATQLKSNTEMKLAAEKAGSWIFTDLDGYYEFEALQIKPDTVIEYRHLYLNKGGRFLNHKTRDKVLQPMYLIKLKN